MNDISFNPLWADSLGAKTTCTLVETPEVNVLIDPGVAVMQPSFPASDVKKSYWKSRSWLSIKEASRRADVMVISHYHYDHFTDFDEDLYSGKLLLVKNPNEFINNSQRERASKFFDNICQNFGGVRLEDLMEERSEKDYGDPLDEIPHARDMDFEEYNSRRDELIQKWLDLYWKRTKNWNSYEKIPELDFDNIKVEFPEGKEIEFGSTTLKFTHSIFHGIELSKTGWVFSTVVQRGNKSFVHSSDLQGPTVEDYADWIIDQDPDFLYLDGPATYLLGYMLNQTNLDRAVENISRIIEETSSKLILYDHHLTREKNFRERTEKVWKTADKSDTRVLTVAEYKNKTPVVFE